MSQHERLKEARIEAGFKSGTEAAKHLGVPVATYNTHENGHRGLTIGSARRYGEAFSVRYTWLLTGDLPKRDPTYDEIVRENLANPPEFKWDKFKPGDTFWSHVESAIPEIATFEPVDENGNFEVARIWAFPADFVETSLRIQPSNIFLVAAPDDTLAPSFFEGDRAIVDASQTTFRGDGIYAIADEAGQVYLRHLTKIIHRRQGDEDIGVGTLKPAQTYYSRIADLKVAGRVVAKVGKI